jgi:hypothetical protein
MDGTFQVQAFSSSQALSFSKDIPWIPAFARDQHSSPQSRFHESQQPGGKGLRVAELAAAQQNRALQSSSVASMSHNSFLDNFSFLNT